MDIIVLLKSVLVCQWDECYGRCLMIMQMKRLHGLKTEDTIIHIRWIHLVNKIVGVMKVTKVR